MPWPQQSSLGLRGAKQEHVVGPGEGSIPVGWLLGAVRGGWADPDRPCRDLYRRQQPHPHVGLLFHQHTARVEKKVVHYLLLSAPWSVLCYYAEELQLRVPLQVRPGCLGAPGQGTVPPALLSSQASCCTPWSHTLLPSPSS